MGERIEPENRQHLEDTAAYLVTYEPPTFHEANAAAAARPEVASLGATRCRWVASPQVAADSEAVA